MNVPLVHTHRSEKRREERSLNERKTSQKKRGKKKTIKLSRVGVKKGRMGVGEGCGCGIVLYRGCEYVGNSRLF